MEAQIERGAFAEESNWVARVLPLRPLNPVLSAILLDAQDGTLHMSGTDQEASSSTSISSTTITPGKVAVSGRLIADIAKSLPAKPVHLKLEGNRLLVACGRASFKIPTLPIEEYPQLPESPPPVGSIGGELFSDSIGRVAFASAKDDMLPVLAGIYLEFGESVMTMAATNRYRLAVMEIPWDDGVTVEEPVILRSKTLSDLSRPSSPVPVHISLDHKISLFGVASGGRRSTMPVLDGQFPDFKRLIPDSSETVAQVNVAELVDAAKRVRIVADKPNVPIKLRFSDSEVFMSAGNDIDAGANEIVECKIEGSIVEIAFNPEYLLEALAALREPTVQFFMKDSTKPALLKCVDDPAYQHLLMPVRITS